MASNLYARADDKKASSSTAMTIARGVQHALHFKCDRWIESLANRYEPAYLLSAGCAAASAR
jgi:hypothetical protein